MRFLFSNITAILLTSMAMVGVSLSIHDQRPATPSENQIAFWSLGVLGAYLALAFAWHFIQWGKNQPMG